MVPRRSGEAATAPTPRHHPTAKLFQSKLQIVAQQCTADDSFVVDSEAGAAGGVTVVGGWTARTGGVGTFVGASFLQDGASGKGTDMVTYAINVAASCEFADVCLIC